MGLSNKRKKRQIISIAISILVLVLVYANTYRINYREFDLNYKAKRGVIDLRSWDPDESLIKLSGEWEFYSGKHIGPGDTFSKEEMEYVEVPGDWEQYLKGKGVENGSGTYRLILEVPEEDIYAIKAKTIRTSHKIYFNGEKVAQAGNPSTDKEKFKAQSKYKTGVGKSENKEIELIVQVTSLNYRSGGIHKPIEIGSYDSMVRADKKDISSDVFLVAICLTLSFYYLLMYLQRNRETYLAYFSGVNLFMGLYLSTMNEQILDIIYQYSQNARVEIQVLTIILTSFCFLRFVYHFFEKYSNKNIVNFISGIMILVLSISLIIIKKEEITSLGKIQIRTVISVLLSYVYMLYILIKALYNRSEFTEYIIVILTAVGSYWGILFLKTFKELDLGNTPNFIIIVMMFSVVSLTSQRLQSDYKEAKVLSKKLKRYNKQKNDFFSKASIQFQSSLESILIEVRKLLEGKNGALSESQQGALLGINQETGSIKRIAEDLMDVSVVDNKEIILESKPINVYTIVGNVLREVEVLKEYSDSVTIKNKVPKDYPILKGDPNKFSQIIYDLLDNSIKFTKKGEISILASIIENQGEIKVKDSGIGIAQVDLPEIFDMFYQKSNNQSKNLEDGLGIGLHIVKQLVEAQGGNIYAESTYGEGTTVTFTLPLYTDEDRQASIDKIYAGYKEGTILNDKKGNNLGREKILIVGNTSRDQKLLESIVENLECQYITAESGVEALKILKKNRLI